MMVEKQKLRRPIGFVVGVLVVVVPLGGYLLYRQIRAPQREAVREIASVAARGSGDARRSRDPIDLAIDETGLRVAGASVRDPSPPPDARAVSDALGRAEAWLRGHAIDPFGGTGTDSLRLFALEVQCWDRLAQAAGDGAAQQALGEEVAGRLRRILDPERLNEKLRAEEPPQGILEVLIVTVRCRGYGIDPAPLLPLLRSLGPLTEASLDRMPAATAALYVSQFEQLGIDVGRSLDSYRRAGVLATRPREVRMTLSDVRALTQEILAYTDLAQRPLDPLAPEERIYLHRALPHFAMAHTLLRNQELTADLLSCLNLAGMTETYGYREGLRVLLTRQNPDGSFGPLGEGRGRTTRLATTVSCLTALSLERKRTSGQR